jgi:hypothetical protein
MFLSLHFSIVICEEHQEDKEENPGTDLSMLVHNLHVFKLCLAKDWPNSVLIKKYIKRLVVAIYGPST